MATISRLPTNVGLLQRQSYRSLLLKSPTKETYILGVELQRGTEREEESRGRVYSRREVAVVIGGGYGIESILVGSIQL